MSWTVILTDYVGALSTTLGQMHQLITDVNRLDSIWHTNRLITPINIGATAYVIENNLRNTGQDTNNPVHFIWKCTHSMCVVSFLRHIDRANIMTVIRVLHFNGDNIRFDGSQQVLCLKGPERGDRLPSLSKDNQNHSINMNTSLCSYFVCVCVCVCACAHTFKHVYLLGVRMCMFVCVCVLCVQACQACHY
jgi:hypothetical protein